MKRKIVKLETSEGQRAVISDDGKNAFRNNCEQCYNLATVVLSKPFAPTERLQVNLFVRKICSKWAGNVCVRFVKDPKLVKDLPLTASSDPTSDVGVGDLVTYHQDRTTGVCSYFVNGKCVGDVKWGSGMPDDPSQGPVFAVIDMYGCCGAIELCEPLVWSTETHLQFPPEFRAAVKTLLLCHRRQDGNLISTLPKFVLLDLFGILGDLHETYPLPKIPDPGAPLAQVASLFQ